MNDSHENAAAPLNEEQPELVEQAQADEKPAVGKLTLMVYDFASTMMMAVILIMVLFTFVFRLVGVSGPSMIPTLADGDWLCVSAFCSQAKNGDIIIITQPNFFHEPIVKRIVAVGGQTVDVRTNGDIVVDGVVLDEPYINERTMTQGDQSFPLKVPEGKVFVMGDNRNHSTDSRSAMIGLIDEHYILGRVRFKLVPAEKIEYARYDY